ENVNDTPVAVGDTFTLVQASTFSVAAPGVLKNDTDADLTPLTAVNYSLPSIGSIVGSADGSFVYKPPTTNFIGSANFTYRASDGELTSDAVKVTINVIANRPPLAKDDTVNARARKHGELYRPIPIYILLNDKDPDSEFDPANKIAPDTLTIVTQPNNRGKLTTSPTGRVSYTPEINFKGIDKFTYNVKDTRKAISNTVTVQVNVK
ncbi:MAG: Ig-like domain-containing protein, partial [Gallionella sp.]